MKSQKKNSGSKLSRLIEARTCITVVSTPPNLPLVENLEIRRMMSADVRSIDGTGNNLAHIDWGSTGEQLIRLAPAAYGDGKSTPAGATRPSARAISNAVATHGDEAIPSTKHLSAYAYLWGQFIDHDMDLTSSATPKEYFSIAVPTGDASFDPTGTGTQIIPLSRSQYAAGTGVTSPRQQTTDITSFIDASMVYGSDAARATALRTGTGGLMKTSEGGLLPFNTMGLNNAVAGGPASSYFVAGDIRVNDNIELSAIQSLFVREHNRLAGQIAKQNPAWSDEQVYQRAKKLVTAEIQSITYNEFLPSLLGSNAIAPYSGYKANVNPSISNEFSTAAFRIGHSMLADDVEFLDNDGNETREEISLAEAFNNPAVLVETGVDPLLKYLASDNSEEIDTKIVDGLRNFLFGTPGAGGLDLASLNIQRGRDHGLSDYNSTRAALGLGKVTSFSQITSDPALASQLQAVYGSVDNVDLWVGGLAENHLPGSAMGATFQRIIADQFTRTRDGDRFWYQRDLAGEDLKRVEGTRLVDIIRRNSGVTNLQDDVFVFNVTVSGRVWQDLNGDGKPQQGEAGLGGRTVSLLDENNAVVDSVKTSPDGMYRFEGVDLGDYHVVTESSTGWKMTTPPPQALHVTKGMRIERVDFGQQRIGATTPTNPTRPTPPPPPPAPTQEKPATQTNRVMPPPPPPPAPAPKMGTTGLFATSGPRRLLDGM